MRLTETQLAAAAKGQFYPTPPEVVSLIAASIAIRQNAPNLGDFSCGTGAALAQLGMAWGAITWGNELSKDRYEQAKLILDHAVLGPQETLGVKGKFDIIFLNPPYDMGAESRLEIEHIAQAAEWLRPNGLFVAILPHHIFEREAFWMKWGGYFGTSTEVRRFPNPEYDAFKQLVVFGQRKHGHFAPAYYQAERLAQNAKDGKYDNDILGTKPVTGLVLVHRSWDTATDIEMFENRLPSAGDILADVGEMPTLFELPGFQAITSLPASLEHGNPAMPCRRGHIVQLGAAGLYCGQEMNIDGQLYLVSGASYKYIVETVVETETEKKTVKTEKIAYQVFALSLEDGRFLSIDSHKGQDAYRVFLDTHIQDLIDGVNRSNPPQYNMDYSQFVDLFNKVHAPRELPGRAENGMFVAQKHVSAALLKILDKSKAALLVGEMGTGKTITAIATLAIQSGMLGGKKAKIVVLSPAVVAPKWKEEAEHILQDVPGFRAVLVGKARKQAHMVPDRESGWHQTDRVYLRCRLDEERRWDKKRRIPWRTDEEILTADEMRRWQHWQHMQMLSRPAPKFAKIRKPILDAIAAIEHDGPTMLILTYEIAKMGAPWEHCTLTKQEEAKWEEIQVVDEGKNYERRNVVTVTKTVNVHYCPNCLEKLADGKTGKPWGIDHFHKNAGRARQMCPHCSNQLWQCVPFKKGGRWPVAEFLSQRYGGRYHLIVDELHNTKGGDTDIGAASQDLISGTKKVVAMTGTIFNGMARSLFYLLYRLNPEFRRLYDHNQVKRFERDHGFVETITTTRKSRRTGSYGYSSNKESSRSHAVPGASPQMVAMLVPTTCFLALSDIGIELPPKVETAVPIRMSKDMAKAHSALRDAEGSAKAAFVRGNKGPLTRWLWAALGWLDHPIAETIEDVCYIPAVPSSNGRGYPKDEVLINLVKENLNEERGVAIFFEQVNRRNAMPRVKRLLEEAGILSTIMTQTVKPGDRMPWIHQWIETSRRQGQEPVLLCNGSLVGVGVDLLEFPTIIEPGQHYNIMDLQQRLARSWRIGQFKDVRIYFLYYEETQQLKALQRIAIKLRAAQQVNGQVAAGLAEFHMDENEFTQRLMRGAEELGGVRLADLMQTRTVGDVVLRLPQTTAKPEKPAKTRVRTVAITAMVEQLGFNF